LLQRLRKRQKDEQQQQQPLFPLARPRT
jgi:hypothetical protein